MVSFEPGLHLECLGWPGLLWDRTLWPLLAVILWGRRLDILSVGLEPVDV